MKSKKVLNIMVLVVFGLVTYIIGYETGKPKEDKEYVVSIEEEVQTFRDNTAHKLYPINYKGNYYIPVGQQGSFMGYMTVESEKGLDLFEVEEANSNKVLQGFSTTNLTGDVVVDEIIFSEADYTIFLVWASWCHYCIEEIEAFKELDGYLEEKNVQMYSVPLDDIGEVKAEAPFKEHLKVDDIMRVNLVGNVNSVPKFVVFDKEGNQVMKVDSTLTVEEVKEIIKGLD